MSATPTAASAPHVTAVDLAASPTDPFSMADVGIPDRFIPADLDGRPPEVARYFRRAVATGTPITSAVHLRMRGRIRIGGLWLPFRAQEVLDPRRGFTWTARVAGLIRGSDSYRDGHAHMHWVFGGVATLVDENGPDIARSNVGRCGAECIWAPTAVLPGRDVTWRTEGPGRVSGQFTVGDTVVDVRHRLDATGYPASTSVLRWGDPDQTGHWDLHPFGGEFSSVRTFGGLTVPDRGRIGWYPGTPRWAKGEFFRFRVTALTPVAGTGSPQGTS